MASTKRKPNRYAQIIDWVFKKRYKPGETYIEWPREDMELAVKDLGIASPKNLGDVVYSFRFRTGFPQSMIDAAPEGLQWVIRARGKGLYSFDLVPFQTRILPSPNLILTKIPDGTPEIIRHSALNDEQALLALVRYNRLIDIFLGVAAYSLQNHLRTSVAGMGQVEVDEIYAAVDRYGRQFVIPVQAKGGSDQLGITQTEQDIAACGEKWPDMECRPVSAQFFNDGRIALFELGVQDDRMVVVRESHYELVDASAISTEDLALYRNAARDG